MRVRLGLALGFSALAIDAHPSGQETDVEPVKHVLLLLGAQKVGITTAHAGRMNCTSRM